MKCIKKPAGIKAIQWTGDNLNEVSNLTNGCARHEGDVIVVCDIRGDRKALMNDWIVLDVNLGFLTMGDYTFHQSYEKSE